MRRLPVPHFLLTLVAVVVATAAGCARAPGADGLRDSFAQQMAANPAVSAFTRSGDDLAFTGPRPDGSPGSWRVHIDTAAVEPHDSEAQPYKGTVTSSWYVDGERVAITGRDSNLPLELTATGLAQECWAFWDRDGRRWSWE